MCLEWWKKTFLTFKNVFHDYLMDCENIIPMIFFEGRHIHKKSLSLFLTTGVWGFTTFEKCAREQQNLVVNQYVEEMLFEA